jgi:hypothetical protein
MNLSPGCHEPSHVQAVSQPCEKELISMRDRVAVRLITALALVATPLVLSAPARADVPGFAVTITQSPAAFTIGQPARTLTAVASTDQPGKRCLKVRWTLTIRTEGVSLDQVRFVRVENGAAFQVHAEAGPDFARVIDAEPDPGQLCRDQTVTGRWDIGFTGPDNGTVALEASAVDTDGRVLSAAGASSRVVTGVAATPSTTPPQTAAPSPEPTEDPTGDATGEATDDPTDNAGDIGDTGDAGTPADDASSAGAVSLKPASGTPSLLGPGLIIGGVLVFLGVALLMRMRMRNRKEAAWEAEPPTGFYTMPRQ